MDPNSIGLFPSWVPGTAAALFHNNCHITKDIPAYIRAAKHTPIMRAYHIRRSKDGHGHDKSWNDDTYDSIDWKHFGESFRRLSLGRKIQISKYTNDVCKQNSF
jgi:uridine kinase